MRKKLSVWKVFALSLISMYSMAQSVDVTGKVTEQDGSELYGVNVTVTGTTNGTITDDAGTYSITVNRGETLTFSYVGFETQDITVGNANVIDVTLAPDASVLNEVVVTALGVSRSTRALQYSVTEVDGANFTKARENNLGNSLSGRIAGVNVSNLATGPGGSSRIIIRGNKTLGGQNQPLYVIDGIPMDNTQSGSAGLWGGSDGGDGLSSINPDDIESITVLKGANAANLYGSRGGNGVINIVTKKGNGGRKGIGVDFNSNFVIEDINNLSEMQTKFGGGDHVSEIPTAPSTVQQASDWGLTGWGPRLDGRQVMGVDGVQRPYTSAGDNFGRFYQKGQAWTNSIAFAGGNNGQNFRLSIADLRSTSVMPNSGFDRTNISLSTNSKFGKRLTLNAKVMYSRDKAKNRPRVSDSPGNANEAVWRLPSNINIDDLRGDPDKLGAIPAGTDQALLDIYQREPGQETLSNFGNPWGSNAWWSAYQFQNTSQRDRVIASGQLRYDITDHIYATGRIGLDSYHTKLSSLSPEGTGYSLAGSINEGYRQNQELNMDFMVGYDNDFGDFSVNAFVGGNRMRRSYEFVRANGSGFSVPYFPAINNAADRNFSYDFNESGVNSVYGSAEVGYNNYLFLTATARQDWFSVLNPEFNSILYPSFGTSFVFSDAFLDAMPDWLSFGKFRASWAQVGIANINAYSSNLTYSLNENKHLDRVMAGFSNRGTIPNPLLSPALSTEFEVGLDLRFFNGRFAADIGYYAQKTTNDILDATISTASGFNATSVNVGELENKGIEVLLSATAIRKGDFNWDISLNFAKNNNKVNSLIEGSDELVFEESRTRTTYIKHIVGQPFGTITGTKQKTLNGQPVYTDTGLPVQEDTYQILGQSVANFTGGLHNSLTYKGINLSFLVDFKSGGSIHSGTNSSLDGWGFSERSLQGREGEEPLVISGVNENGEPLNMTLTPDQAKNYWGNLGGRDAASYIYDAGFVKLRQLTLGYSLPSSVIEKTPFQKIEISFVGRNLANLWKNIPNIDPESAYSFNAGAQGLDYFGMPSTRSYGFNLNISY